MSNNFSPKCQVMIVQQLATLLGHESSAITHSHPQIRQTCQNLTFYNSLKSFRLFPFAFFSLKIKSLKIQFSLVEEMDLSSFYFLCIEWCISGIN
jgi:hypothetical protein